MLVSYFHVIFYTSTNVIFVSFFFVDNSIITIEEKI